MKQVFILILRNVTSWTLISLKITSKNCISNSKHFKFSKLANFLSKKSARLRDDFIVRAKIFPPNHFYKIGNEGINFEITEAEAI